MYVCRVNGDATCSVPLSVRPGDEDKDGDEDDDGWGDLFVKKECPIPNESSNNRQPLSPDGQRKISDLELSSYFLNIPVQRLAREITEAKLKSQWDNFKPMYDAKTNIKKLEPPHKKVITVHPTLDMMQHFETFVNFLKYLGCEEVGAVGLSLPFPMNGVSRKYPV